MLLPPVSDLALKEWAVAVNALAQGKQILAFSSSPTRGNDEESGVVHPEFLLYPTYENQVQAFLKEEYYRDLEVTLGDNDIPGLVTLGYWCQVTDRLEVREEQVLNQLSAYHIWKLEYVRHVLNWRPGQPLTVALLRVYRLKQPQALPVLDEYLKYNAWVELGQDVPLGLMMPALSDQMYAQEAGNIRRTLSEASSAL